MVRVVVRDGDHAKPIDVETRTHQTRDHDRYRLQRQPRQVQQLGWRQCVQLEVRILEQRRSDAARTDEHHLPHAVEAEDGLEETFDDVAAIIDGCHFRDCTHADEPGCAVREAVRSGAISLQRWDSYQKLQKELSLLGLL